METSFFKNSKKVESDNTDSTISDYTDQSIKTQNTNISQNEVFNFARKNARISDTTPFVHNIDTDQFDKYGVAVSENNSNINELNKQRARNQSVLEQAGNALLQGIVDIGLIGAAQGFADLYDVFNGNIFKSDNNFRNPVSQYLEELGEQFRNDHPIYVEDEDQTILTGGLAHFGWYAKNFPSIFSFLSFMIPSSTVTNVAFKAPNLIKKLNRTITGTAKAIDTAEDLIKANRAARVVNKSIEAGKLSKSAKEIGLAARLTPGKAEEIKETVKLGVNSVLGTYMANYTFARDIYNENYANTSNELKVLEANDPEAFNNFLKRNKEITGYNEETGEHYSIDDISKKIAHNAAMTDFYWNILTAYPMFSQMYSTVGMWKGLKSMAPTSGMNILNKSAAENIGKSASEITSQLAKRTFKQKAKDWSKNVSMRMGSIGRGSFDAGLGNAINVIAQKEGERRARTTIDSSDENFKFDLGKVLSYSTDGNLWDAAIWGVLGGVFSNVTTRGSMKLAGRLLGKEFLLDEKMRESEITNRNNIFQVYSTLAEKVRNNQNILDPIKDEYGNIKLDSNGEYMYNEFTSSEDKRLAMDILFDHYIQNTAIDAANVGNLDLLKEYLSNKNVTDALIQSGLVSSRDSELVTKKAIDIIDQMEESYNNHVTAIDKLGIDPYITRIIATENVRREFDLKDIDREISTLNGYINSEINRLNLNNNKIQDTDTTNIKISSYINRIRTYRDRYNFIKNKYGIDYDVERRQLLKTIDILENEIKNIAAFDDNMKNFINYRSRIVFERDAEGNPIITNLEEIQKNQEKSEEERKNIRPKYKLINDYADAYFKELTSKMSNSESVALKEYFDKFNKTVAKSKVDVYSKSDTLRQLYESSFDKQIDRTIIASQINVTDSDVRLRAEQVKAKATTESEIRQASAMADIKSLMQKYDANSIYEYLNGRLDIIKEMPKEDYDKLENASFVLGLNDERFNEIINEIAGLKNTISLQKIKDNNDQASKSLSIKPVQYFVDDDENAVAYHGEDLKNGDLIAYKDPDLSNDKEEYLVSAKIVGTRTYPGYTSPATSKKYKIRVYKNKIKVFDRDKAFELARKENRFVKEGKSWTYNYTDEELKNDRFFTEREDVNGPYDLVEKDINTPETIVPDRTVYIVNDIETGETFEVSKEDIRFKIDEKGSKKLSTERKIEKGTKGKEEKKSPTESKSEPKKESKSDINVKDKVTFNNGEETITGTVIEVNDKTDIIKVSTPDGVKIVPKVLITSINSNPSTGEGKKTTSGSAKVVGNTTKPGGIFNQGDRVYTKRGDKFIVGTVTEIDEDDIKVLWEGKTRPNNNIAEDLYRADGYLEVSTPPSENHTTDNLDTTAFDDYVLSNIDDVLQDPQFINKYDTADYTETEIDNIKSILNRDFDSVAKDNNIEDTVENRKIYSDRINEIVDKSIKEKQNLIALTQDPTLVKFSTIKEMSYLARRSKLTVAFADKANKMVEEYAAENGIDISKYPIIDALQLLRYMYKEGLSVNEIANMFGVFREYLISVNADKNSNFYVQFDNIVDVDSRELYESIVIDDAERRAKDLNQVLQKFDLGSFLDTATPSEFDAIEQLKPGDVLDISNVDGDIVFRVNGLDIGYLPTPVVKSSGVNAGSYQANNEFWITDIKRSNGYVTSKLINMIQGWFLDSGHDKFMNIVRYWSYNLNNTTRTEYASVSIANNPEFFDKNSPSIVMPIVDLFMQTDEYKYALNNGFIATNNKQYHGKTYSDRQRAVKLLNHLRKLYVYANANTLYKLQDWTEKLANSYDLMIDVANNPNSYKVTVKGLSQGKAIWTQSDNRGIPSERIANYNRDYDQIKLGVTSKDGFIDFSGQPIPSIFPSAKKGRTFITLPYKGYGPIDYIHAYPVSTSADFIGIEAKTIVEEIKTELYNRIIEKLTNPTTESFSEVGNLLNSVFYNKRNQGPDNTGYSLFRLNYKIKASNVVGYLTSSVTGNRITLSAGDCYISLFNTNNDEKTGNTYFTSTIDINGLTLKASDANALRAQIDKLFRNIDFDININFIKNEFAVGKRFGESIVSKDEDGKFVIEVPGYKKHVFETFNDFILKNNLVEITTEIGPNRTNYDKSSANMFTSPKVEVLFEKVSTTNNQNNVNNNQNNVDNLVEKIEKSTSSKPIKGSDVVDELMPGMPIFKDLNIIPNKIVYDATRVKPNINAEIVFDKDHLRKVPTVYVGNDFLDLLKPKNTIEEETRCKKRAVKLLIHEQLHYLLAQKKNADNIQKLKEVYEEFKAAISDDNYKSLFEDIAERTGFDKSESINIAKDFLFEDKLHETEQERLEEFLIESLTNKRLVDYLNGIKSTSTENGSELSIWQKLFRFLADVFGFDVKKGSLYETEFNSLADVFSNKKSIFADSNNINNDINNINNDENKINSEETIENEELTIEEQSISQDDEYMGLDDFDSLFEKEESFSTVKEYRGMFTDIDNVPNQFDGELRKLVRQSIYKGQINFKC